MGTLFRRVIGWRDGYQAGISKRDRYISWRGYYRTGGKGVEFPCGACICDVIVAEIYPPDITVIHNNGICKAQGFHCIQSRIYSCGGGY